MKIAYLALIGSALLTGCSSVQKLGSIGCTDYYSINKRSIQGPNFSALAYQEGDAPAVVHTVIGGPGIGQTVVAAGAQVAAAPLYRPARWSGGSSSVSASASTGSVNATGTGTGSGGGFTPPGHINNPSGNH